MVVKKAQVIKFFFIFQYNFFLDTLIEQLLLDKDSILRYGAMYTIGLAYCGTSNNNAIKKLLHVAVSDVSGIFFLNEY